jgi:hypothetical protein
MTTEIVPTIISGPINVVRLEGKINNITKILYIFMDVHYDLRSQTQCDDFDSIPFDIYLKQIFKNPANKIDYFNEEYLNKQSMPGDFTRNWAKSYFGEALDLFSDLKYLKEKYGKFSNIRLHYFDFRFLTYFLTVSKMLTDEANYIDSNRNVFSVYFLKPNPQIVPNVRKTIQNLKTILADLKSVVTNTFKFEKKPQKPFQPYKDLKEMSIKTQLEFLDYYLSKVNDKYSSELNKENIKKYIIDTILPVFDFINKKLDETLDLLNKIENFRTSSLDETSTIMNYTSTIISNFLVMNDAWYDCFLYLVDIFFLRRFIDKDYITKCIVFCGGLHGVDYIKFLTTYYDFTVTHVANNVQNLSITDLNKAIKKDTRIYPIARLFLSPHQCSDISNFPPDFVL